MKTVEKTRTSKKNKHRPQNQHKESENKGWTASVHRNVAIGVRLVVSNFQGIINLQYIPLLFGYNAAGADFTAGGSHKPIVDTVITASIGSQFKMLICYMSNGPAAIILHTFIFRIGPPTTSQKKKSYTNTD